ncbi:hypothetical protein [Gloeobacter violaceus]|nr:hypothetical protein [Gloeobacter violaceus]
MNRQTIVDALNEMLEDCACRTEVHIKAGDRCFLLHRDRGGLTCIAIEQTRPQSDSGSVRHLCSPAEVGQFLNTVLKESANVAIDYNGTGLDRLQ